MVLNDSRHRIVHDFVVGQGKELESTKNKLQAIQDSLDGYRVHRGLNFSPLFFLQNRLQNQMNPIPKI
jgi:hypothetical protein